MIRADEWGPQSQAETPYTAAGMTPGRPRRDPQRGNSLLLALIVMSSLATLGSLTVVSVQSSLKSSTNERSQTIAMYAAESGGAIAMNFLRSNFDPDGGWSAYVHPNNSTVVTLASLGVLSSGALPSATANPFSVDQNAWYSVELFNNRSDPHFAGPDENTDDGDCQILIRSTGHGPQGSVSILEWEIRRVPIPTPPVTDPPTLPTPPGPTWSTSAPLVLVGWHVVL